MLPRAEAEILDSLHPDLVRQLTSRQLATVMVCLDRHWHKARAFEAREILSEGCIYDPTAERLIELYPPRYFSPASLAIAAIESSRRKRAVQPR
jgi:hypothetical protein